MEGNGVLKSISTYKPTFRVVGVQTRGGLWLGSLGAAHPQLLCETLVLRRRFFFPRGRGGRLQPWRVKAKSLLEVTLLGLSSLHIFAEQSHSDVGAPQRPHDHVNK